MRTITIFALFFTSFDRFFEAITLNMSIATLEFLYNQMCHIKCDNVVEENS